MRRVRGADRPPLLTSGRVSNECVRACVRACSARTFPRWNQKNALSRLSTRCARKWRVLERRGTRVRPRPPTRVPFLRARIHAGRSPDWDMGNLNFCGPSREIERRDSRSLLAPPFSVAMRFAAVLTLATPKGLPSIACANEQVVRTGKSLLFSTNVTLSTRK